MRITKKALVEAAAQVADRAPNARNRTTTLVSARHPRGLLGHTLHKAGLTPQQLRAIQTTGNYDNYLNPAATNWARKVKEATDSGTPWATAIRTVR